MKNLWDTIHLIQKSSYKVAITIPILNTGILIICGGFVYKVTANTELANTEPLLPRKHGVRLL